jgi:hypothetical protein
MKWGFDVPSPSEFVEGRLGGFKKKVKDLINVSLKEGLTIVPERSTV